MLREASTLGGRIRALAAGHDPRRRALEQGHMRTAAHQFRHELHGARSGADDSDAAPRDGDGMVPAGRVEQRSWERLQPRDLGDERLRQAAAREGEGIGDHGVAVRGAHVPGRRVAVPPGAGHTRAQTGAVGHAGALGHVDEVAVDLGPRREHARPVRMRVVGEPVQVRGHVARDARVGVVAPRAADAVAALEQHERLPPVAQQGERHADPGEARTDDRDLDAHSHRIGVFRFAGGSR